MLANHVISFKGIKGIEVLTDNIAPFALKGQVILYSETDDIRDGNYIMCAFKDKAGATFKQLSVDPETKKNYLLPVSMSDRERVPLDRKNLKFMYRIVGILSSFM